MGLVKRLFSLRGPSGAILFSVLILAAGFVLLPQVTAERTPIMDAELPTPSDGTTSVATDAGILVFGGDSAAGRLKSILLYDPVAQTVVAKNAELPTGRSGAGSVWTGTHAYIFGGWTTSGYTDQILRYDPGTDTITVMAATLPSARVHLAAAWVGGAAYLFGGSTACSPCETDQILRYDPTTDTLTILTEKLPTRRAGLAATTDGSSVFLFGGVAVSPFQTYKDVLVYDPDTGAVTKQAAEFPTGRYHLTAQWAQGRAWAIGGTPCMSNTYCETIWGFDPGSGQFEAETLLLATGRHLISSATFGGHIYVVGGHDGARLDEILRFSPPGAPPPVNAPPVLAAIDDQGTRVGNELVVTVSATHPQNKAITLSAPTKPAGATFFDDGDGEGRLVWTPTPGDEGSHDVTVEASDGQLTDSSSFAIQVDPADAPFVTAIPDRVIEIGTRLIIEVEAWDPEDRPITLGLDPMPSGALFIDHGNGTGTFDWTAAAGQNGTWSFTVNATADGKTGTTTFKVTVRNVVHPPTIGPFDPVRAIIDKWNRFVVTATHPDGDPITLSTPVVPTGASFTDLGDGTAEIMWHPTSNQIGTHLVTITAQTAHRNASAVLTIDVMREHDFAFTPLAPIEHVTSPGETVSLPVQVKNTGNQSVTVALTTNAIQAKGTGWSLTAKPASVTLASLESTVVVMNVTGTTSSVQVQARLRGTIVEEPTLQRVQNFIVKVPIHIEIALDEEIPVADAAMDGIGGEVILTWENGSPAKGRAVSVEQTPEGFAALTTVESGTTDSDGKFQFDYRGDPRAILLGDHAVLVTVTRSGQTDTQAAAYAIVPL